MVRVLIIEDHPIVVAGFRALLLAEPNMQVVHASTAAEGLKTHLAEAPDLSSSM